jgi:glycosyltransferase involved in cell wall biosynthesis
MPAAHAGPLAIAHTESSQGWGGQEIRVLSEAAGFIARGHRVTLLATPESRIAAEAARFGVPLVHLPIGAKRARGILAVLGALRTLQLDVINTHSSTDSWLVALALRYLKARGRTVPVLVRTRHVSVPVKPTRATRWLYRKATSRTVTTGDALRAMLIQQLGIDPARIDSIPTGIDPALFGRQSRAAARAQLQLPPAVPLVGIVATLRSWKGHRYLVDALAQMAHRDAVLVIVGSGPQEQALRDQVSARGLGERVVFAGQQDDVVPWLAALDVFALPSYANEGVPQALLQAMFAGVPCVTTDAGAIPEIAVAGDTALVVAREDPASLARALDALLDDRAHAAQLAVRAHALVMARYTRDAMLDRMEVAFRAALGAQRPARTGAAAA